MICPHCGVAVHIKLDWCCFEQPRENSLSDLNQGPDMGHGVYLVYCPNCNEPICYLIEGQIGRDYDGDLCITNNYNRKMIYPQFPRKANLSEYVPLVYAELYSEAEQVSYMSPRASATLSRYLLQMILHEELKILKRNLEEEIAELEKVSNMPSSLIGMLQVMRKVANFGAHPKKSTHTGEIVDVELGEAEIMLELIQEVFDVLFIKPKRQEEKLAEITEKFGITL